MRPPTSAVCWPPGSAASPRRILPGVEVALTAESGGRQSVVLAADPISVGAARAWLSSLSSGLIAGARQGNLELVISEVFTNAIRHGRGDVLLAATPKDGYLCVQVTDGGEGFVPRPRALSSGEHGGFGLFLVERLTRRWGMTRENGRTRVWFEFDYEEPPACA